MSKKSLDLDYMKKTAKVKTGVRAGTIPDDYPIICYGVSPLPGNLC